MRVRLDIRKDFFCKKKAKISVFDYFFITFRHCFINYIDMGSGIFYAKATSTKKDVKRYRFLRSLFFVGILLVTMPFNGKAQVAPAFTDATNKDISVCENGSVDISSFLDVNDPDIGDNIAYSIVVGEEPQHGSVSVVPFTVGPTTGSTITIAGVAYTPAPGYYGTDEFQVQAQDDFGNITFKIFRVVVRKTPGISLPSTAILACTGDTSKVLPYSGSVTHVGEDTALFQSYGLGQNKFIVPPTITSVKFDVYGAVGGKDSRSTTSMPGNGGHISGNLTVTPGMVLNIFAGAPGSNGDVLFGAPSGQNGGGAGNLDPINGCGGAGGDASDIRIGGTALSDRVVVAGGGGGAGFDAVILAPKAGGAGGGSVGLNSDPNEDGSSATGGTQVTAGLGATYIGYAPGQPGALAGHTGGNASVDGVSGGGGGGWFGGGGGVWTGGGGGSSYADPTLTSSVVSTPNVNNSTGSVMIRYTTVGMYTIAYSSAAHTAGFADVTTPLPIPTGGFPISIPQGAPAAIYSATLTLTNGICSSPYEFTVEVRQTPQMIVPTTTPYCDGGTVSVPFSPSVGTSLTYDWVNDNTGIGAPANGSGSPLTFTATNTGTGPTVATFTVTPSEFGCPGNPVSFTITANPLPRLTIDPIKPVCEGTTSTSIPFSNLQNVGSFTNNYKYLSGNFAPQVFTVPQGVTSITFDAAGAIGGSDDISVNPNPGKGGRIQGNLSVAPGDVLNIFVGGRGFNGSIFGAAGGFNGGGNAYYWPGYGCAGAGGGASDIRLNGTALSDRAVVAAGGGGNGWDSPAGAYAGGDGGGLTGANGADNVGGSHAWGGTQAAGGAGANRPGWISGSNGSAGMGGFGSLQGVSGGGGGGYFGGGGGVWTGGGGGSSYADPAITTLVSTTPGYNLGYGTVTINYTTVSTYTMTWTGAAAGLFADVVTPAALPASSFPVSIPTGTAPGTYTADITIFNGLCSNTYPIALTINAAPTLNAITAPAPICEGLTTTTIKFTGGDPLDTYTWTNDNSGVGIATTGTGDITAFTAANPTDTTITANITVTAHATNGCASLLPATFAMTVYPTPTLSSTLTPASYCSGTAVDYLPTSGTPGTTFDWAHDVVTGLTTGANFGTDAPNETLVDTLNTPVAVAYVYTLTANGCSNIQTVTATIKPVLHLTSSLRDTVCSGTVFNYIPSFNVPTGTTFTWGYNYTAGSINPPITGQTGNVNELQGSIAMVPIRITYNFELTNDGCTYPENVELIVKPIPTLSSPLTISPEICSGDTVRYTALSGTPKTIFQWNRSVQAGILEMGNTNNNEIREALTNTISAPVKVNYEFNLSAEGCAAPTEIVTITVNPYPSMTSTRTPAGVCSGTPFTYTPTATTDASLTTFDWIRSLQTGVSNFPNSGVGTITETLTDTTVSPVKIKYAYTINFQGCTSTDTVTAIINPIPKFTSSTAAIVKCDSVSLSYSPTSSTFGATFNWTRPLVLGLSNPAASGTGIINEVLHNTTNTAVTTTYNYTIMANGCAGDPVSFDVKIQPNPTLSSSLTPPYTCSNAPFSYVPASYVDGATFDWRREFVPGVGPLTTGFGTGTVNEVLYDSLYIARIVTYKYRVTANGCTNLRDYSVKVLLNPGPDLPSISTNGSTAPCAATMFQTFGAGAPPASGVTFDWYAFNASVWASTADNQFTYVNFNNAGWSYVRLRGEIKATGCTSYDSIFVNVGTGIADQPKVIRYEGQFICLQSDMYSYQWGYDDAATFASVTVQGATQQNWYFPNADLQKYRYWVITERNGCKQKSYFNSPLGVNDLATAEVADLKVYPNPTQDNVNVEINSSIDGNMQVDLLNMLGQKINMTKAVNHKATIDVSSLPAGCYLVDCYRDGIKIATSRFIKN